jgi:hypothetical protein
MLVGSKKLSAFDQCRGHQPSLSGLHRFFATTERVAANEEMVAHRALSRACRKRNVNVLSCSELAPGTEFCYISRILSIGRLGCKLVIFLKRTTVLQQSDEIGTAEATDWKSVSRISNLCRNLLPCRDYLILKILTQKYRTRIQGVPKYRSLQVVRRRSTLRERKRYCLSTLPAQRSGLR